MGAWIETLLAPDLFQREPVAPYVGAWIETENAEYQANEQHVAPYVGAWIETKDTDTKVAADYCRTLRGCVD